MPKAAEWHVYTTDSPGWFEQLEQFDADFYYLPDYADACARVDGAEAFAFFYRDEAGSFFMPVLSQPMPPTLNSEMWDAYTPYGYAGPLLRSSDRIAAEHVLDRAFGALVKILDKRNCATLFIRCHPLCGPAAAEFPHNVAVVTHGDIVVIDLNQSERDRWLQLRNNHRRDIIKLTERDFDITIDETESSLSSFTQLYEQTMRRVSAQDHFYFPSSFFYDLCKMRGCRVLICNVCTGGRVACSGLYVLCGKLISYHLGGTDEEFMACAPSKLMHWRVANWAASQHAEYLNLGGGLGGRQDSLFNFKAGFSRLRAPFFTVRAIIRRSEYNRLCQRKTGALTASADIGDFFPPYRRPD
jgi:hypothetical protein